MVGNFGVEVDGVSGLKSMVGNFRTSPENGSYGGDECCFDCYTTVEKKSSAWIAHRGNKKDWLRKVNPDMVPQLEDTGLSFTGKDENGQRMEIVEFQTSPVFRGSPVPPGVQIPTRKTFGTFLRADSCSK
ncbi:hypothetical protein L1987_00449 [Smallanthus sonchifolius]|uniref:Uncharacterized protein n=1 Tax=Smallanthus sonchifolius TaxID=185202 RepID=A0ACB9K2A3_9ASTR|nr:hypothetical protein L1987_00449 [Smallanthus sonchifolius]